MRMKKLFNFVKNRLTYDNYFLGIVKLLHHTVVALRKLLVCRISFVHGIILNDPVLVEGRHEIGFGRNIHVGCLSWIAAISKYAELRCTSRITLDDRCNFSGGMPISHIANIAIGDGVLFGSDVYIANHSHGKNAWARRNPRPQRYSQNGHWAVAVPW